MNAYPTGTFTKVTTFVDEACYQKTMPSLCTDSGYVSEASIFALAKPILSHNLCDSIYTYCDSSHIPRPACSASYCCSLCNSLAELTKCPQRMQEQLGELLNTIKLRLTKDDFKSTFEQLSNDQVLFDRMLTAVNRSLFALGQAIRHPEKYSSWSSCTKTCMADDAPPWYGPKLSSWCRIIPNSHLQSRPPC